MLPMCDNMMVLVLLLLASLRLVSGLALESIHSKLFSSIKSDLSLKQTDFTGKYDAASFSVGEHSGSCEWWDESKGSKLTGVSVNSIKSSSGFSSYQINAWMGPAYNCPHMLLTIATDPAAYTGVSVRADYVARGPTPLGSDQTVVDMYYGKDVLAWYDSASSKTHHVLPPRSSFSARLLRSPIELAISGLDIETADTIATQHVSRWIAYVLEAKQNEPRQRGAINTRDDKQRQYSYLAEVADCVAWVGADFGPKLGAARTGPVAEAYVGGGG